MLLTILSFLKPLLLYSLFINLRQAGMHRLFQPSKSPGTVHRQYVQEAFLWLGQDLEYIVTRNFVIGRDAEVALDRKKRAGLYMVVRPILFFMGRAE